LQFKGIKKFYSTNNSPNVIKIENYGNFHTIDWLKDQAKDRFRHKWLLEEKVLDEITCFKFVYEEYNLHE
jgi:hypothetical protein